MTGLERLEKEILTPYIDTLNTENIGKIYKVFQDYYGEQRVDLQFSHKYNDAEELELVKENTKEAHAKLLAKYVWRNCSPRHLSYIPNLSRGYYDYYTFNNWDSSKLVNEYFENLVTLDKADITRKLNAFFNNNPMFVIIVHFPHVVIENEDGRKHEANNFYIKIPLTKDAKFCGNFLVKRTTFTKNELQIGYMHSHCPSSTCDPDRDWTTSCLGSGPIIRTESRLSSVCDLDVWMLFCNELERYISVESLSGGPYIRMSQIPGNTNEGSLLGYNNVKQMNIPLNKENFRGMNSTVYNTYFHPFIREYASSFNLPFRRLDGQIKPGFTYDEFLINISQAFITYINNLSRISNDSLSMIKETVLVEAAMVNESIHLINRRQGSRDAWRSYVPKIGHVIGIFHGEPLTFQIEDNIPLVEENHAFRIMHPRWAGPILQLIIDLLNIEYGREVNSSQARLYI